MKDIDPSESVKLVFASGSSFNYTRDSPDSDRPISYTARFRHSGYVNGIDLAIKEQLEAFASVPIDTCLHRSRFLDRDLTSTWKIHIAIVLDILRTWM